jgi:DNA-binding LacI/PurR family transcriptional regulator
MTGSPGTSLDTRDAVRAAAAELGYAANPIARALATGQAFGSHGDGRLVIAVVGASRDQLRDPYVATVVAAVAEVAEDFGAGVGLEWLAIDGSRRLHELAEHPDVRGVILVNTVHELLADLPRRLSGRVVSIGIGAPGVRSYDVDSEGAAEAVVRHMLRIGRRAPVMLTGPAWLPCVGWQSGRFVQLMTAAGMEPRTITADFTTAAGAIAMTEALRRWPDLDAVFATCDAAAFGALDVLLGRGIRVPHDVALAGFDDVPFAALSRPALTTGTHPVTQIAATAALSLLEPSAADSLPRRFGSRLVLRETA